MTQYENKLGAKHQIYRLVWSLVWLVLGRPFPRNLGRKWKIFLLRLFGADIHGSVSVYSSATVYMPCNLIMKKNSCLGDQVDCYNVAPIYIGENVTVSQKTYLCTAPHENYDSDHHLITAPIKI